MHGPPLVGWLLVTGCGAVGVYRLLRLRAGHPRQRQTAGVEGLMGVGMAAMALPGTATPPPTVLAAFFTAMALWSLALLRTGAPHQGHHLVEALAMVYMALGMIAPASPAAHTGHGTPGGMPWLTGLLAAYFVLYALRAGPRLLPTDTPGAVGLGKGDRYASGPPGVATACRLTLALAMLAMLLTL